MARKYSTLRTRFVQSKFVAKTNILKTPEAIRANSEHLSDDLSNELAGDLACNIASANAASTPAHLLSTYINETLPTTMETLRVHVDYLRSLPLPVAEKNRLLLKYWAMECRLEAVRLLLDEAQQNGVGLGADGIDPACFDLSGFNLRGFGLLAFDGGLSFGLWLIDW